MITTPAFVELAPAAIIAPVAVPTEATVAPVAEVTVVVATAQPAPAPIAAAEVAIPPAPAVTIAPAPMPVEELQQVLGSAGLTLASTDPEKLRAAQQAAQQVSTPPRLGREPKQVPPPPAEPLVQIETR